MKEFVRIDSITGKKLIENVLNRIHVSKEELDEELNCMEMMVNDFI